MKKIRYFFEALLLHLLFLIFRLMPLDTASNTGGWIGRQIGPRLATSRKALRNLRQALPNLSQVEQTQIITDMWDNLGRVIAEYPHIETIAKERVIFEGEDVLNRLFESGLGAVFIGPHIANWEVKSAALLLQFGKPVNPMYRPPNNPWSDRLLMKARSLNGKIQCHPKSRKGGQSAIQALKEGRYLGILIDQKYNEGIPVPFFGIEAMTNPIFVQLCQKYKCPLIPVQNIRVNGAHFKLIVHEPLQTFNDNTPRPVEEIIKDAHALMEEHIKQNPGQWLWLHRRWDSKKLES